MKKSTLKSVTRLLFVTTQYAALLWVSISYLIALYATVRLGQVFRWWTCQSRPLRLSWE